MLKIYWVLIFLEEILSVFLFKMRECFSVQTTNQGKQMSAFNRYRNTSKTANEYVSLRRSMVKKMYHEVFPKWER